MTITKPSTIHLADVDALLRQPDLPADVVPDTTMFRDAAIGAISDFAYTEGSLAENVMLGRAHAQAVRAHLDRVHSMLFDMAINLEVQRQALAAKEFSDAEFKHQANTLRDQRDLYKQDLVTINTMLIEEAENRLWCHAFEEFVEAVNEATKLFEMKGRAWTGTAQWTINVRVNVPITADTEDMVRSYADTAGPKIARLISDQLNAGDITDDLRRQMELDERSINVDIDLVDANNIYWDENPSR